MRRDRMLRLEHAASLGHLALTLALLGHIDQGRARVDEALSEARGLDHPFTVAFVSSKVCAVEAAAGLPHDARRHAEELLALSNEHGFPLWLGVGLLQHGRSSTALGQAQDGLAVLARGLSVLRAAGAVVHTPRALCFLAEAHAKVGHVQEGRSPSSRLRSSSKRPKSGAVRSNCIDFEAI
jgi:hypothetical protein